MNGEVVQAELIATQAADPGAFAQRREPGVVSDAPVSSSVFEAGEDLRPPAVDLNLRVLAQLVVGDVADQRLRRALGSFQHVDVVERPVEPAPARRPIRASVLLPV